MCDESVIKSGESTYRVVRTADRWHPWEYARAAEHGWERLGKRATKEQAIAAIWDFHAAGLARAQSDERIYHVQVSARWSGALGVNSERRAYTVACGSAAQAAEEATRRAYAERLENVVVRRLVERSAAPTRRAEMAS